MVPLVTLNWWWQAEHLNLRRVAISYASRAPQRGQTASPSVSAHLIRQNVS